MKSTNRDLTWDAIKGIAILLMVIGHSGCPSYLRNFIYLFHMGLFYYASGHFFKAKGVDGFLPFLKKKLLGLYWPFVKWGGMYVLLHNVFYFIGWYGDEYSMTYTLKKLLMTALFKDVENLLIPLWFLQSLFKGLVITYIVCLIPKKWLQWTVVVAIYLIGWIFCEKDMHLFYSMNRDMGIVIAIFLGYELKNSQLAQNKWCVGASFLLLVFAAFYVKIELASDNIGPLGAFPILTLAGAVFIRRIVLFCQQNAQNCYRFFAWMGRNSLYILIFHFTGFHLLSKMMVSFGIGIPRSLSNIIILDGINNNYWFIPYTLSGLVLPFIYLKTKQAVLKYCNSK